MGLRILLADDDPDFRELLSELLTERGHVTSEIGTGAELQKALSDFNAQLLILDLRMPSVEGKSVMKLVEANQLRTRGIDTLVVTGSSKGEELDLARSLAYRVFSKPLVFAELLATVSEVEHKIQDSDQSLVRAS